MTPWQTFIRRHNALTSEAHLVLDRREYRALVETITCWAAAENRRLLDDEDRPA